MLKGRGKTFAPKKVPLRKPGPAPVSSTPAPPSIALQLQTPESTQQLEDTPAIAEKDAATWVAVVQSAALSTQEDPQASSSSDTPTNSTSTPQLKRKEREEQEEDVPAPSTKRHIAETEAPVFQAAVAPMVGGEPSDSQLNKITVPTPDIPAPNNPTRKDRAPLPSAPPSKSTLSANTVNAAPRSPSNILTPAHSQETRERDTHTIAEVPSTARDQASTPIDTNQVASDVAAVSSAGDGGVEGSQGFAGSQGAAGSQGVAGSLVVPEPASLDADITAENITEGPAVAKGKAKRKTKVKKSPVTIQSDEDQEGTEADGTEAGLSVPKKTPRVRRATVPRKPRKKPDGVVKEKRKRVRAGTPDDASDQEIDPEVMTMGDLTKDLKIGKKFSRYAEIKELEEKRKQEAIMARMRKNHPEMTSLIEGDSAPAAREASTASGDATTPAVEGEAPAATTEREPSPEPAQVISGPRMRLLNGRMILDETSLQIDRHANAQLEREGMDVVEENDFSRLVNSGTFMKRTASQAWDMAANQLFYRGLRQFGTDFEMIASMFPHRNRRQIKLKFNKEEKVNAAKINRILMNPKDPIDLDEWEKMADKKLESLEVIHAEREKYDAEQREEIAKFTEAAAESMRKKKESIKGSEAARRALENMSDESEQEGGFGAGGSNKENGKGKKKKAMKKRGRGRNDDDGEIVGMID